MKILLKEIIENLDYTESVLLAEYGEKSYNKYFSEFKNIVKKLNKLKKLPRITERDNLNRLVIPSSCEICNHKQYLLLKKI